MPKQYTFKTTRDTEWLEPILDKLPAKERSRYIRMALALLFDSQRPAVTLNQAFVPPMVSPSETQVPEVRPVELPNIATEWEKSPDSNITNEPTFKALDEDLDSKLDNMFD